MKRLLTLAALLSVAGVAQGVKVGVINNTTYGPLNVYNKPAVDVRLDQQTIPGVAGFKGVVLDVPAQGFSVSFYENNNTINFREYKKPAERASMLRSLRATVRNPVEKGIYVIQFSGKDTMAPELSAVLSSGRLP